MAITIYGIRNCDTMRKARGWLDLHGVAHAFHDYRADGVDRGLLEAWVDEFGWAAVLNRAGTTFRKLPDRDKADLDAGKAIALMRAHPAMIRRPVLDTGAERMIGFDPARYAARFGG